MRKFRTFANGDEIENVKQGWSWPAFFLSGLWALHKGLWLHAVAFFVACYAAFYVAVSFGEQAPLLWTLPQILPIVLWLVFGALGNKWRERRLLRRGFRPIDELSAKEEPENIEPVCSER